MYTATTRAIQVTVRPQYLPDQSGENFDIEIPTFSLDLPSPDRKLN